MQNFKRSEIRSQVLLFLVLTLSLACAQDIYNEEYNYDYYGRDWRGICRFGRQQSPINIDTKKVVSAYQLQRIKFDNYDRPPEIPLMVVNTGHTVQIDLTGIEKDIPSISGGLMMDNKFEAQSVQFHWGHKLGEGSEHTINSVKYDLEIQIVHKNAEYADKSVAEASSLPNGLAVLAILFKYVPLVLGRPKYLDAIYDLLPQITQYQSNATIDDDFSLSDLFGDLNNDEFFSYQGSLTTPECGESVIWTVFKTIGLLPIELSRKFDGLQDVRSVPLLENYRLPQDLNGRVVYFKPLIVNVLFNIFNTLINPFSHDL